mmetsp:Transcript_32395/g.53563  ORF Transcript_32395/g.53563 Transcript_32395/m.53563 type:complete len:178 (-) Transcript_32395:532-1065(-)
MKQPLYQTYPVNSVLELTLKGDEKVKGVVYCTDEVSQTVVLKKALTHTTLASEIFMVQADAVTKKEVIEEEAGDEEKIPVGNVSKKALEQQEKKAIRMAEEALQHINQKATPEGQAVFDRLLKACNEVVWKGEAIQVLSQIQVDPPYAIENCRLLSDAGRQSEGSLERVKKIVGHSS